MIFNSTEVGKKTLSFGITIVAYRRDEISLSDVKAKVDR